MVSIWTEENSFFLYRGKWFQLEGGKVFSGWNKMVFLDGGKWFFSGWRNMYGFFLDGVTWFLFIWINMISFCMVDTGLSGLLIKNET
jgi:hypothetical protein